MIALVDYGMGNLFSVQKAFRRLKTELVITSDKNSIQQADRIILPGVGHFGQAMFRLQQLDLIDVLSTQVLKENKPILGICLGMQLMADFSEEGNVQGLGFIGGHVKRMRPTVPQLHRVPHVGWNTLSCVADSVMNKGIKPEDEFYFVHAYQFCPTNPLAVLHATDYHESFVSAVQQQQIVGVQYHPEKSHDCGLTILKNFLEV
jgi:glutamine amidotransferase